MESCEHPNEEYAKCKFCLPSFDVVIDIIIIEVSVVVAAVDVTSIRLPSCRNDV